MKTITFLLMLTITSVMFAGTNNNDNTKTIVSGKVIDKISGEEIAGAEIKVDGKTVYTDLNGNFSANIDITHTKAIIKYVSYNEASITLNPLSYNTITIELASR